MIRTVKHNDAAIKGTLFKCDSCGLEATSFCAYNGKTAVGFVGEMGYDAPIDLVPLKNWRILRLQPSHSDPLGQYSEVALCSPPCALAWIESWWTKVGE